MKQSTMIIGIAVSIAVVYLFSSYTGHLANGRYQSIVVPDETAYLSSKMTERSDKAYILDTRTGDYEIINKYRKP